MKKKLLSLLTFALCIVGGANLAWADGTLIKVETTSGTTNEAFTLGTVGEGNFYVTITPANDSKSSYGTGNYNYARTSDATEYFSTTAVWKIGGAMNGTSRKMVFNIPSAGTLYVYARTGKSGETRTVTVNEQTVSFDPSTVTISNKTCYVGQAITFATTGSYPATASASINFSAFEFVPAPAVAPGTISFSPTAGSVAAGTSITLTSTGSTTIEYQWSSAVIGSDGDWTSAETYSDSNKPIVPSAGSTNTVLSVMATNAYGTTYGSASYTPVRMALRTIYSLAGGKGSAEVTVSDATVNSGTSLVLKNTNGRIKLTAATGFNFKNGDAISFSGAVGNTSKAYGIKYGPTTDLGTDLYVAAGEPCNVSGTLTLASETSDLYIGRYDGTTTTITSFDIRQLFEATSETFTGVKIDGTAAAENTDYTIDGTTITLDGTFATAPNVALVKHIVFTDSYTEDQDEDVTFGAADGEFFVGTATIDGTTYTVKAACAPVSSLKVQYMLGETLIKEETLATPAKNVGDSYTVPFRMYVEKDGALYQTTKNSSNPWYGDEVTLTENHILVKSLSTVDLNGGTIELFEDFDGDATQSAEIRASNCSSYNNTAYTSANDLPAGKYTFIVKALNKGRTSSVKVGDQTVFAITDVISTNNSWTDKTFTDIVVPEAGKLSFVKGSGNAIDFYDILIAIRQPAPATVSMPIGSAGFATFSSLYEVAIPEGVTAYAAYSGDASTVTMKILTDYIPASEGVVVFGNVGDYNATVASTGATLGYTNLMKPWLVAGTPSESTYYTLGSDEGNPVFKLSTGGTLAAGKAYLVLPSSARQFTMVFDDATGIDNVNVNDNEDLFYDLQGRRVAQPQKGLYIVNGKKVVIK